MKIFYFLILLSVNYFNINLSIAADRSNSANLNINFDILFSEIHEIAESEIIIKATLAHNLKLPVEVAKLDNTKWKKVSPRDNLVKTFMQNEAALYLRAHLKSYVSEAFISGADGKKVAFLTKTSSWDHSGKPKHEVPMTGKDWKGEIELDESTGINQIQISAPIKHNKKSIGSIVLGISVVDFLKAQESAPKKP